MQHVCCIVCQVHSLQCAKDYSVQDLKYGRSIVQSAHGAVQSVQGAWCPVCNIPSPAPESLTDGFSGRGFSIMGKNGILAIVHLGLWGAIPACS